jgi:5-(carboxyamino)imidazole ribonucleotide mutase
MVESSDADVFIAIAGLSAALPGVVAAHTCKPVIGVPVSGGVNLDSLLSVVQMPPGIPVAAVGLDRGDNAAILAAEILGLADPALYEKMKRYRKEMAEKVEADSEQVVADVGS